jgi:hypothetical protein
VQKAILERKRLDEAEREALVAEYRRGDVTQRELAGRAGISVSCLCSWLRRSKMPQKAARSGWIELPQGLAGAAAVPYKVRFPGGTVLELARGFVPEETARLCRLIQEL